MSLKTIIYLSNRFKKSIIIMAGVLLGVILLVKLSALLTSSDFVSYSGLDFTLVIYVFVYYIAIFTDTFNHLSMYGITRKKFFTINSIFIILTSLLMLVIGYIFYFITKLLSLKPVLFLSMIYGEVSFETILVGFSLLILGSFAGWLCSLLTYKFGKYMIFVIVFVPQILAALFSIVVVKMNIADNIYRFCIYYIGVTANQGTMPLRASLNFLITAVVIAFINWILIRKLPVRT